MMRKIFLFGTIFIFFFSCKQEEVVYRKSYFDFDSLVNRQAHELGMTKSKWKKISSLNKVTDTALVQLDTLQWKNELDVFRQLDAVNKGVFKGYYSVRLRKDMHSNLMVRSFRFDESNKDNVDSPVPFVDFYYFDNADLRKIVAVYKEDNLLFSSSRQLSLEFAEGNPKNILQYEIRGFQKMILSDSVLLNIKGSIF